MLESWPSVSIIIPARPDQTEIKALIAAQALAYPGALEIILARGRQPSVQRNQALRLAQGDLIYFIDDDSQPPPDTLLRAVPHFKNPTVQMVGGPNLCPANAPGLEQLFAVTLASALAFGPSRARYCAVGATRASSEKELILCNLMARRESILALGGFDEALYPNEENALMDGLQKQGGTLLYDPQLFVHRRPRPTFRAFCRMLGNYGRGRAEQFRLHPTPGSILNFVPPLFCAYLLTLVILAVIGRAPPWVWWPLIAYALAVAAQTIRSMPTWGLGKSLGAAPFLVLTHLLYGWGFWRGLFNPVGSTRRSSSPEVSLERISSPLAPIKNSPAAG